MNAVKLKTVWVLSLSLVVAAALTAGAFFWDSESDQQYIEKVTGIKLPLGSILIHSYSNDETFVLGQFQIPKAAEADFVMNNDLELNPNFGHLDVDQRQLPENWPPVPTAKGIFGHSGRSNYNTWQFLYDKKVATLWCLVKFPDMSGQAP